ncbi:MAG: pyridoxal-phosphate dependent enzyme [Flavobacteriales bacterium]
MRYSDWSSGISCKVKRLDLIHPVINGNKFFKLKYNLQKAEELGVGQIISFGGAWSNHIHALAYACMERNIKCIGIIRGERPIDLSDTLKDAEKWGMRLEFITREAYSEKDSEDFKMWLLAEYGPALVIPEGGANYLGINGCMEILEKEDESFDHIYCSAGTGAMAAGLALSLKPHQTLHVVSVLKGNFMRDEIRKHLNYFLMDMEATEEVLQQVRVYDDYHHGGYAKTSPELMEFISSQEIPMDQVYSGKLFFAIEKMHALANNWEGNHLIIHCGGLQGLRGATISS